MSKTPTAVSTPLRPTILPVQHIGLADEIGDEGAGGALVDVGGRPFLRDRAVLHHADHVRHRQRLDLFVSDKQSRHPEPLDDVAQFLPHFLAQFGVEIGERLVEQQHTRLGNQCTGERQPLLLAAGEIGRRALLQPVEMHQRERRI